MNNTLAHSRKKERVNLFLPPDLFKRATLTAKTQESTLSDLFRTALRNYLELLENDRIEKELEEGYRANQKYYSRMSKEWEVADAE